MADEEAPEQEEVPEPTSGGGLKWAIIGLVVALVLGGGGTAFVMLRGGDDEATETSETGEAADHDEAADGEAAAAKERAASEAAGAPADAEFYSLEPFIVNINDGERDRFLKLKADLELSSPELAQELERRMPQVKDVIISLLSSQSFSDIKSIEGKDLLREELLVRLNTLLRKGKVRRVFFTEFVVQ